MMFIDKAYSEKRKILRQFYVNNSDAHKIVKKLAFKVRKKITDPIISKLLDYDTIIDYLISGYLCFEIGSDYLSELDPDRLQLSYRNNKMVWIEHVNTSGEKYIETDKLIYISYYKFETSFLSSVYEGLIKIDDEDFIFDHVDYIVHKLSVKQLNIDDVLNVNPILMRNFKIKKIKDKYENN